MNKWFAVGNDSVLYYLGKHEQFRDADAVAYDMVPDGGVWLIRDEEATQWLRVLSIVLENDND